MIGVPRLHNAVVGKELRTRMRGWRSVAVLTVYMAVLGLIAVAFLLQQAGPSVSQSSQVGIQLFQVLAVFQLVLILFITPPSTAGAISGERQRQTWDLLVVTRLSSFGIVWGKLLAGLAFNLLLIFGSLPLLSLVFLFGGVAPDQVLHTYVVFLVTVLFLGTISLFVSALCRRLVVAQIVSNMVSLALAVGLSLLALYFENWGQQSFGPRGPSPLPPLSPVAQLDPVVALVSALPNGSGGTALGGLSVIHHAFLLPVSVDLWEAYAVLASAISIALILVTTLLVRSAPRWVSSGVV